MTPLLSVVMTACNGESFIGEAIGSILAQDMPDFEFIVIDDGSSDRTAAIVAGFADPRIALIRNPANLGIASAANIGLSLARGQFIARMDCDDVALPDRLSAQLAYLEKNPEVEVCGGGIEIFGKVNSLAPAWQRDEDIKANFLIARGNIYNPTSCFRRSLLERRRLRYNPSFLAAEDLAFWIDAMRAGAVFGNLDRTLVRYRWYGGNMSRSGVVAAAVNLIRTQLIRDFFPQLDGYEAAILASAFADPLLPREGLSAVLKRALAPVPSVYGESRLRVTQHVEQQLAKLGLPAEGA